MRGIVWLCLNSFMTLLCDAFRHALLMDTCFHGMVRFHGLCDDLEESVCEAPCDRKYHRVTAASTRRSWRLAGLSRVPPGQHVQEHNTPNGQNPEKRP